MFERFVKKKESILDEHIVQTLNSMKSYGPDSPEYPALIDHLDRLTRMKQMERSYNRVSPDTMAIVAGNLLGILVIVAYEQRHVMVSKGLGFILKTRN